VNWIQLLHFLQQLKNVDWKGTVSKMETVGSTCKDYLQVQKIVLLMRSKWYVQNLHIPLSSIAGFILGSEVVTFCHGLKCPKKSDISR